MDISKKEKIISWHFLALVFLISFWIVTSSLLGVLGYAEKTRDRHNTRYGYHAYATDLRRILEDRVALLEQKAIIRLNQFLSTRINRKTRCLIFFRNSTLEQIGRYGACLGLPAVDISRGQWVITSDYLTINIDILERFTAQVFVTNEHDIRYRNKKIKVDFKPEHFSPYLALSFFVGIFASMFLTGLLVVVRQKQDESSRKKFLADTVHDTKNLLERLLVTSEMLEKHINNPVKIKSIVKDLVAFAKLRQICSYTDLPDPSLCSIREIVTTVTEGVLVEYEPGLMSGTRDCHNFVFTRGPVLASVLKNLLENAAREAQDIYGRVNFDVWSASKKTHFKIENDCDHKVDFTRIMSRGWSSSGSTGQGTAIASDNVKMLGGVLEYSQDPDTRVVSFSFCIEDNSKPEPV